MTRAVSKSVIFALVTSKLSSTDNSMLALWNIDEKNNSEESGRDIIRDRKGESKGRRVP